MVVCSPHSLARRTLSCTISPFIHFHPSLMRVFFRFYRALGAKIGKNCTIWAGGRTGLMTEPDLVELGDRVSLDECSVVAHINSRGKFALNKLNIGTGAAMRTGSRLLSGAQMEAYSMLMEHALLPSGDIAEGGGVYVGWPARRLDPRRASQAATLVDSSDEMGKSA